MTLYDADGGRFATDALWLALIARDFTPQQFAEKAGLEVSSVYNALKGRRVRRTTALKIFKALESRRPMNIVYEERGAA